MIPVIHCFITLTLVRLVVNANPSRLKKECKGGWLPNIDTLSFCLSVLKGFSLSMGAHWSVVLDGVDCCCKHANNLSQYDVGIASSTIFLFTLGLSSRASSNVPARINLFAKAL